MPKSKKIITLLLLTIFCLGLATGCDINVKDPNPTPPSQNQPEDNKTKEEERTDPNQNQEQDEATGVKQNTGIYQGLIDSNSIEIKIDGAPEDTAYKAFALSASVIEGFEQLGLDTGDKVSFTYTEEEDQQPLISEISKK